MLVLEPEILSVKDLLDLRAWVDDPRCDALLRAANAEQMVLQASYSNALLKNPLEAIGMEADTEKQRRMLAGAARLAIFIEVLSEFRSPKHEFVSVKLSNDVPNPL